MKLTKFKHACFVVELDDQALIVDPGGYSDDFVIPDNVVAVVITHQHADHHDTKKFSDIVRRYPDASIFTTDDTGVTHKHTIVRAGDTLRVGEFELQFSGGDHALIDTSIPRVHNVGVMINDLVYYPGDSFAKPNQPIHTLLLPVAAPWMKIADALDFIRAIHPQFIIPTHDAILSEAGRGIVDRLAGDACRELSIPYRRLSPDTPITIART